MSSQRLSRQLFAVSVMVLGYGFALLFLIGGFFFTELPFVFALVMTLGFLQVGERGWKRYGRLRGFQQTSAPVENERMIEKLSGYVRVLFGMLSIILTLGFFILYIIGMSRLAQPVFAVTTSAFAAPLAFVLHLALIRNNAGKKFVARMRNTQKR